MRRINKRTTWVLAVALAIAAAVSLTLAVRNGGQGQGSYSLSSKTARHQSLGTRSLPGLSEAFIGAVNSTDIHIVPAKGPAAVSAESAVSAALAQAPPGSSALAAGLVTLTDSQHPAGVLAWAIQTTPAGAASVGPARPPGTHNHYAPPPRYNFAVNFVDASTGAWLEGVSGYSPGL